MLNRRQFFTKRCHRRCRIVCLAAEPAGCQLGRITRQCDKDTVKIIQFSDAGKKLGPARVKKVHKTDEEWKQQLTRCSFRSTRQQGTERAFTGAYDITTRELSLYLL